MFYRLKDENNDLFLLNKEEQPVAFGVFEGMNIYTTAPVWAHEQLGMDETLKISQEEFYAEFGRFIGELHDMQMTYKPEIETEKIERPVA